MTKKQHYMTYEERLKLEALYNAKVPVSKIAKELGFCRQTIYNEIKRGLYLHTIDWWDEERYSAQKGQIKHNEMQTGKGCREKIGSDRAYADYLENKMLHERYSPAAALAAAKAAGYTTSVCVSTLYSYIDKGLFLHLTNKHLWNKSRKKKQNKNEVQRIAHPKLPNIAERPEAINQRSERGHWEMDLIIGKANTAPVLLTLTERSTRKELIFKLPNRKAATVRGVFDALERKDKDFRNNFKSITTDNGPEFLEYDLLTKSIRGGKRFEVYYCHSYAAWEKGSNENHNRMVRRWFPKGTDFRKVSKKEIAAIQDWMNGYPRKILNWKCPNELYLSA